MSLTNGKLWGLSAGTVITKETKGPNNREALLFGCIVSFAVSNPCISTCEGTKLWKNMETLRVLTIYMETTEIQMVRAVPFRKLQKIWVVIRGDAILYYF